MAISQRKSRLSSSGAFYRPFRKKRKSELGRESLYPKLGSRKLKAERVLGGNLKWKLFSADTVNVVKAGKSQTLKIKNVVSNPANPNFARRNILTKGSVVDTEQGKVRITSRPGQHPVINGVFV
ncbi:MAG TPA: 30S ribosomal protein S8e [Candidatus Nanoarchaeia archaeon]|nr:30S ribosomal protein S8e [Candidatus Nanoarchaeia archaeon]